MTYSIMVRCSKGSAIVLAYLALYGELLTFVFDHFCAIVQAIEILDELVDKGSESMDVRNKEEVVLRMRAAVASKQFGQEDILCPLIADVWYPCIRSATISITMMQHEISYINL